MGQHIRTILYVTYCTFCTCVGNMWEHSVTRTCCGRSRLFLSAERRGLLIRQEWRGFYRPHLALNHPLNAQSFHAVVSIREVRLVFWMDAKRNALCARIMPLARHSRRCFSEIHIRHMPMSAPLQRHHNTWVLRSVLDEAVISNQFKKWVSVDPNAACAGIVSAMD